jgi:hypothetical protein
MNPAEARLWIVKASLVAYGLSFVFFVLAPALGYPMTYPDAINIVKIIVPVFAGYVGAAAVFVGTDSVVETSEPPNKMLSILVKWPIAVFGLGMVALLVAFFLTNTAQYTGNGMTPNTLSLFVSLLTALLAATTGAISSYLFKVERRSQVQRRRASTTRSAEIAS